MPMSTFDRQDDESTAEDVALAIEAARLAIHS
jgi:hypothetical protein